MADNENTEILDCYWKALQSGALDEARRLRDKINEQHASLQASLDLLDELLDAGSLFREDRSSSFGDG